MAYASVLWKNDIQKHRREPDKEAALRDATGAAGKRPFALMMDYRKIAKGPGKLTFQEYVDYRLYDRAAFPDDDARMRFISERIHWPLCYQCSDRKWDAATEDKWISELMVREAGLATTRTLAVVGGMGRRYGRTPHLDSEEAFAGFMAERTAPVFAKINGGIGSEGATRIVPLGDGQFDVAGLGKVGAATVYRNLTGAPAPYLLQDELRHHPDMAALFGPRIGTIRAISFVADGVVHTPITVLKLTAGDNIADNFWRDGNMLADIDRDTGVVRRVVRGKGPSLEVLDTHPETGATMAGAVLPMWDEVKRLAQEVGALYAPVKYQSLDIAITEDGPTVVEVNTGSAFNLHQIARGEGFFSNEVLDLFRRCGAKIETTRLK